MLYFCDVNARGRDHVLEVLAFHESGVLEIHGANVWLVDQIVVEQCFTQHWEEVNGDGNPNIHSLDNMTFICTEWSEWGTIGNNTNFGWCLSTNHKDAGGFGKSV